MCLCILFVGHLLKPRYKRVFVFFVCPDYQAIRQLVPRQNVISIFSPVTFGAQRGAIRQSYPTLGAIVVLPIRGIQEKLVLV